ncbi:MAG: lysophospholipid acyltransferase family protein [Actinomycetota bacterium]
MDGDTTVRSDFFFRAAEFFLLCVFRFTGLLFRYLPPRVIDAVFSALGAMLFHARPGMKRRLLAKLSAALPEITDQRELERIGREVCSSALRPIYDLFLFGTNEEDFMRALRVEGMDNLERAESRGKGVLLLGSHLGAFTLRLAVMMRLGKPYAPVMYNPDSSPVPRYVRTMAEYGSSLGYDPMHNPVIFAGEDTVKRIEEHLSRGGKVSLNFDVDGGFIVDFMGKPAAMASGAAHFALNTGAAIVPFSLQRGDGVFGHRMRIYEPLEYELSGDRASDLETIMAEVVKAGERPIRETPGQWMSWFGLWQWWDKAAETTGRRGAGAPVQTNGRSD